MPPKSDAHEDDWQNVSDAKKRKQIQDRLAQRARRKRLREERELNRSKRMSHQVTESTSSNLPSGNGVQCQCNHSSHTIGIQGQPSSQDALQSPAASSRQTTDRDESMQFISQLPQAAVGPFFSSSWSDNTDTSADLTPADLATITPLAPEYASQDFPPYSLLSQVHFPFNIFTALYLNGLVLGQICSMGIPTKSTPADSSVPLPLHPTDLQLTTIHHRWIDRLPFPKARNMMISFSTVIDEENFLHDVMTGPSFELVPGRVPWDPRAYRIVKGFADKWGWLFY